MTIILISDGKVLYNGPAIRIKIADGEVTIYDASGGIYKSFYLEKIDEIYVAQ